MGARLCGVEAERDAHGHHHLHFLRRNVAAEVDIATTRCRHVGPFVGRSRVTRLTVLAASLLGVSQTASRQLKTDTKVAESEQAVAAPAGCRGLCCFACCLNALQRRNGRTVHDNIGCTRLSRRLSPAPFLVGSPLVLAVALPLAARRPLLPPSVPVPVTISLRPRRPVALPSSPPLAVGVAVAAVPVPVLAAVRVCAVPVAAPLAVSSPAPTTITLTATALSAAEVGTES